MATIIIEPQRQEIQFLQNHELHSSSNINHYEYRAVEQGLPPQGDSSRILAILDNKTACDMLHESRPDITFVHPRADVDFTKAHNCAHHMAGSAAQHAKETRYTLTRQELIAAAGHHAGRSLHG